MFYHHFKMASSWASCHGDGVAFLSPSRNKAPLLHTNGFEAAAFILQHQNGVNYDPFCPSLMHCLMENVVAYAPLSQIAKSFPECIDIKKRRKKRKLAV